MLNPLSPPDHEFAMLFTSTPNGASMARRIAGKRLRWWGLSADTPALLIGELTANAVTHCRCGRRSESDFFLRMAVRGGTLRVEVADSCPDRKPEVQKPADDAETGRGLMIVDALASAWGVSGRATGKTVWCEIAVTRSTESPLPEGTG